jgi:hypothetical protein
MSRQVKLVIVAAVTVALLACAAVFLIPPAADNGSSLMFRDSKPTDINSVSIQNSFGTTNIKSQDQGYIMDDMPSEILDISKFIDFMTYCGAVNAKQLVEASPKDLSLYGLSSPAATVDIKYNDNSSLVIQIGNQERISGNYYFSVEGKSGVYLMEADRCSQFLLPKKDFADHHVTPTLQLSSPFSAIRDVTFTGGPLTRPVTLKAVTGDDPQVSGMALSFGAPTHILVLNGIYELDQTYGADLFNSLLGITANDIVGYLMTSQQIADFGFSSPYMQVAFDLMNGTDAKAVHYSLAVIKKDDKYYMTCNDNGVIYEVPEPQFLNIQYDKLPVRWFLKPLIIDVSKVELSVSGETLDFVLSGSTNDDKQVTCNGDSFNMDRFRTFYQLLTSAAGDGTLIDGSIQAQGEPLMTLTYYYLDSEKQPDTVKIYKGDALRDYAEVNGVVEFAMRETYLTRVQDAVNVLFTDKDFETEW